MAPLRCGFAPVLAAALAIGVAGCVPGAPERASNIQNVNAITDDIAAVRMTESPSRTARPNVPPDLRTLGSP